MRLAASLATGWLALATFARPALAQSTIDFDTAWFSPSLIEDRAPVCADVLAYGRRFFAGDNRLTSLDWRAPVDLADLAPVDRATMPTEQDVAYVVMRDRKIYWLDEVAPGNCGGACERRQIYVTPDLPPPRSNFDARYAFLRTLSPTPAAHVHRVFRANDSYYTLLIADEQLQLHELTADATWQATCRVRLTPGNLRLVSDESIRAIYASLDALRAAVDDLRRGAGSCGTMQTHNRSAGYVTEQLEQLVYRPRTPQPPRVGDDSAYDVDMRHLEKWALTGASEHAALARYKAQFSAATADLTDFYTRQYNLGSADAEALASFGLREAVSAGISFYVSYTPFGGEEQQLRAAILERRPLADLQTIDVPLTAIDGAPPQPFEIPRESLLNVSLGYPEALAYLLERGADPNSPNPFGKTPLMYAAQQNALQAAELLLAAGADPNAATTWPADHCYYTLSRASMTPLHYAVRYASAEVVDLLLEAGAAPYIQTQANGYPATNEYPLNWLRKYTAPAAVERNPNMAEGEVERLAALLAVPSAERRTVIAADLVIAAESRYAAGDVQNAYRLLMRAAYADDTNTRALSDLSLVALRAEQASHAVTAAMRLLGATDDAALKSNAWFNIGLACEQPNARFTVRYGDGYACRYSSVFPFLQAWQLRPTTARAEKLAEVFAQRTSCKRTREDGSIEHYILADSVDDGGPRSSSRIYVYHAAAQLGAADVSWALPPNFGAMEPVTLLARHELGQRAITVFESLGQFAPSPTELLPCRPRAR